MALYQNTSNYGPGAEISLRCGFLDFTEIKKEILKNLLVSNCKGGVRGREVERRPCNHEVPSSSPRSGSQLWDFSLAHTFGASTGVVPRKQNRERLV